MLGLLSAPFAVFFKLDFLGYQLLILAGPIIYPFARRASKLYKSILGHSYRLIQNSQNSKFLK